MMISDHSDSKHISLQKGTDFDATISVPALCMLISSLRDKQVLSSLGLKTGDISVYEQLEKMSYSELRRLVSRIQGLVEIRINLTKLEHGVNGYKRIVQENEDVAWLIQNGANKSLVQHIFPSIPDDVVKQQIEYLRDADCISRVKNIPEDKHAEIVLQWHKINKLNISEVEKLRNLKEQFPEFTLQQLFVVTSKDYL